MNKARAQCQGPKTPETVAKRMKALIAEGKLYRGVDPRAILAFDTAIQSLKKKDEENKSN